MPALPHLDHLAAYPEQAHVLEGLRVTKSKTLSGANAAAVADSALDPGFLSEMLLLDTLCQRKPSSHFVRLGIDDIVCAIRASRLSANIESQVNRSEHFQSRIDIRPIHSKCQARARTIDFEHPAPMTWCG